MNKLYLMRVVKLTQGLKRERGHWKNSEWRKEVHNRQRAHVLKFKKKKKEKEEAEEKEEEEVEEEKETETKQNTVGY